VDGLSSSPDQVLAAWRTLQTWRPQRATCLALVHTHWGWVFKEGEEEDDCGEVWTGGTVKAEVIIEG